MAKVYNPLSSERASGKYIGKIFQSWRGLNIVRKFTMPTIRHSATQIVRRQNFATLSVNWRDVLTDANRLSWNSMKMLITDLWNESVNATGLDLYQKINADLLDAGKTLLTDAPISKPMAAPVCTLTCDGTGNTVLVTKPSADEVTEFTPFSSVWVAGGGVKISTVDNVTIITTSGILPSRTGAKNTFRRVCFLTESSAADQTIYLRKAAAVDLDAGVHLVVLVERHTKDGLKSTTVRLDGVSVLHTG